MTTESDLKLDLLINAPLIYDYHISEYMNLTLAEVMEFCEQKHKWWNENRKAIEFEEVKTDYEVRLLSDYTKEQLEILLDAVNFAHANGQDITENNLWAYRINEALKTKRNGSR